MKTLNTKKQTKRACRQKTKTQKRRWNKKQTQDAMEKHMEQKQTSKPCI